MADRSVKQDSFLNEDARWKAVARRDARADGQFVFAVRTTGVYCRPSCAARRAKRENVAFYLSAEQARREGYRACLRCRPDDAPLHEKQAQTIGRACEMIERSDAPPDLRALASAAGLSRFHFHHLFKQVTGLTPKTYAQAHRAARVREEITTEPTITQAIYRGGYGSSGRFYSQSTSILGMHASDYRAGGRGQTIRFATGQCTLGSILVAATELGVCCIMLGNDPDEMARELQDRFEHAELMGGDREFEKLVAAVIGFVERPAAGIELPLHVRGTAFQHRVWNALRGIPLGKTASYAEIAKKIGVAGSARAVARACASNPVALAIPCHRVVRSDGSLSGYRWGVQRKAALLKRESAAGKG